MTLVEMQAQLRPSGLGIAELILLLAAAGVLLRICWTDFFHLKIYNRDVLVLLGIVAAYLAVARPEGIWLRLGLGVILFAVAFAFWLFGKAGAGDAKLLGIVGVLIPPDKAMVFALLILALTLAIYIICARAEVVRFLPIMAGRRISELIASRRIPYGVPIALATIALLVPRVGLAL